MNWKNSLHFRGESECDGRARSTRTAGSRGSAHGICTTAAWVLCALLFASAAHSRESVTLPGTRPGELIGRMLKLCAAPQLDAITRWLTVNSSPSMGHERIGLIADGIFGECAPDGGLRARGIVASSPDAITVLLSGRKIDLWSHLVLSVNAAGKIAGIEYQMTAPPADSLPKPLTDSAIRNDLGHFVARLAESGRFSGIVVVARGRKAIVTVSAGYADRSKRTPITGRTQFTLGSMGKMFTAAGIGQLVDAHELSYGDPVGKFFPDYPNRTVRERVTVGMLLSHTAGLGDFLAKRTPEMMTKGVTRAAEFMPLYDREEPRFTPGASWAYSNAGLALAGAILEKVSGEDYALYIRSHIFAPAGMTQSDPNNVPHRSAGLVVPYTHVTPLGMSRDWHPAPADIGSPAGGAISTADDLVRFADALRNGKLVSHGTLMQMATNHDPLPDGPRYGYAMELEDVYGSTVVGHSGGFPGVSTHLQIFLNAPYTIVVLENQDPPAEAYVSERAVALVAARIRALPARAVPN